MFLKMIPFSCINLKMVTFHMLQAWKRCVSLYGLLLLTKWAYCHYSALLYIGQYSGHVNANFCVYYAWKPSCTQNHGSYVCSVCKKRDSVSTRLNQNMPQAITEHTWVCERKACIVCEEHFISLNCLMNLVVKVLLKCGIRLSISFHWYTFPKFCMQISRPLAYCVRISWKLEWPLPVFCTLVSFFHNLFSSIITISQPCFIMVQTFVLIISQPYYHGAVSKYYTSGCFASSQNIP